CDGVACSIESIPIPHWNVRGNAARIGEWNLASGGWVKDFPCVEIPPKGVLVRASLRASVSALIGEQAPKLSTQQVAEIASPRIRSWNGVHETGVHQAFVIEVIHVHKPKSLAPLADFRHGSADIESIVIL